MLDSESTSALFYVPHTTDYGRSMKPFFFTFFIEIQNFWAWADKFWGIWGVFGQTIRTHFGSCFQLFNHCFYKNLSPHTVKWIWDSSIFSSIKPKLVMGLFDDFCVFTRFYQFLHDLLIKLFCFKLQNNFMSTSCKNW